MINPKYLRETPEIIKESLQNRGDSPETLDTAISLDKDWLDAVQDLESLQQQRNAATPKGKPSDEERAKLAELSQQVKSKQDGVSQLAQKRDLAVMGIPNIPDPSTPIGETDEQNKVLSTHGKIPEFASTPLSHDDLGTALNGIDFDKASQLSGSRFSILKGPIAKLERALGQFMLDQHSENNGYTEVSVPVLVHAHCMEGTGQFPKFKDDQYQIQDDNLWLSPTGEVQLTNYFRETTLKEEDLPIKVCTLTPCFRKEAGSYGKDIKGLIRQHQFLKVELVQLTTPETSASQLETLIDDASSILDALELPYRKVLLCTGDLGFSACKTIDLEVWFPSQNTYREISSCSNFSDFQARRAMIKYKSKDQKGFVHTLNGSGLAIGRTLAAVIENYQQEDGSIQVPKCLQKYINMEVIR